MSEYIAWVLESDLAALTDDEFADVWLTLGPFLRARAQRHASLAVPDGQPAPSATWQPRRQRLRALLAERYPDGRIPRGGTTLAAQEIGYSPAHVYNTARSWGYAIGVTEDEQ